jgi:glycosyltransferase involved in cell wall biosynthesis
MMAAKPERDECVPNDHTLTDIAVFIPSYSGGGAEKVALFVARSLAEVGYRVDLVTACGTGELRGDLPESVRSVELSAITEILALPSYLQYLRHQRPRLVIALIHSATLTAAIGKCFFSSIPVILSVRNAMKRPRHSQWWLRNWFGFVPERLFLPQCEAISAVSNGVAREVEAVLDLPKDWVSTIYNPVSSQGSDAKILDGDHLRIFEKPVVLGVGRLVRQKNFSVLLQAFAEVCQSHDANLVILGRGPFKKRLRKEAIRLGIADRLFLPGRVPNTHAYMVQCAVFVLCSDFEGCPNVCLEALEAGAAIVATNCRYGPDELLDRGRFGRLVEVGDVMGLAAAISEELGNYPDGANVDNADRLNWLTNFDPTRIARQYVELASSQIGSPPAKISSVASE